MRSGKTVLETMDALGVCRATVYNLLKRGELTRASSTMKSGKGKGRILITNESIVRYIKTH